jgi:cardiolipin synthase A/B
MAGWLETWWPVLASSAAGGIGLFAAGHAVLNKRDVRSAAAWAALSLLVPLLGALLYLLLGINRIRRAADRVRGGMRRYDHESDLPLGLDGLATRLATVDAHLIDIARATERINQWGLAGGNRVRPLRDGDEAYPAMIEAIEGAQRSIGLVTYIFDSDPAGRKFVEALAAARARGVEIRILIDDAGARYSRPSIDRLLRSHGVPVARFLRVWGPWSVAFANLRNHRKILVVDGTIGFTGGMNIRHGCVLASDPPHPTRDVHFRLDGPIVTQLADAFAEDWTFTTGEVLEGEAWFPQLSAVGDTVARVITDGPDRDLDCMRWALHAALASAERRIRIVTPYFLPDEPLITALNVAALRGIEVDIVLPVRGNLRIVSWAMRGEIWKVLGHGCRIWQTPATPFDHAKLMTVDGAWTLVGSTNWDPRSLRLNFELGVECYDRALVIQLDALIDERIAQATQLDADQLAAIPWPARLRDGVARLLSPYL